MSSEPILTTRIDRSAIKKVDANGKPLTALALILYIVLADLASNTRVDKPFTVDTLRLAHRCTAAPPSPAKPRRIANALRDLEHGGLITIISSGRGQRPVVAMIPAPKTFFVHIPLAFLWDQPAANHDSRLRSTAHAHAILALLAFLYGAKWKTDADPLPDGADFVGTAALRTLTERRNPQRRFPAAGRKDPRFAVMRRSRMALEEAAGPAIIWKRDQRAKGLGPYSAAVFWDRLPVYREAAEPAKVVNPAPRTHVVQTVRCGTTISVLQTNRQEKAS